MEDTLSQRPEIAELLKQAEKLAQKLAKVYKDPGMIDFFKKRWRAIKSNEWEGVVSLLVEGLQDLKPWEISQSEIKRLSEEGNVGIYWAEGGRLEKHTVSLADLPHARIEGIELAKRIEELGKRGIIVASTLTTKEGIVPNTICYSFPHFTPQGLLEIAAIYAEHWPRQTQIGEPVSLYFFTPPINPQGGREVTEIRAVYQGFDQGRKTIQRLQELPENQGLPVRGAIRFKPVAITINNPPFEPKETVVFAKEKVSSPADTTGEAIDWRRLQRLGLSGKYVEFVDIEQDPGAISGTYGSKLPSGFRQIDVHDPSSVAKEVSATRIKRLLETNFGEFPGVLAAILPGSRGEGNTRVNTPISALMKSGYVFGPKGETFPLFEVSVPLVLGWVLLNGMVEQRSFLGPPGPMVMAVIDVIDPDELVGAKVAGSLLLDPEELMFSIVGRKEGVDLRFHPDFVVVSY